MVLREEFQFSANSTLSGEGDYWGGEEAGSLDKKYAVWKG